MSDPLVRWGGTRAVACLTVEIVFVLLLVVGVPLLAFRASGSGAGAVNVEVCDEAGVLQGDATVSALEKLHFRTITTLVVVTLDTGSGSDFDTAVLAYAREKHPEWISSSHYHPTRWADGLVILGLSPSGRKVGTYFGEDVKVSYSRQQEIQAAGKDSFRDQQWETGIEQMARSASDIVDHSDRRKGEKLLFSAIGIAGGLTLTFFMIRGRSRARAAYSRALDHYTRVTAGYGSTRAKAGLIPSGEAHGAQVLARFAWFEDHYAGLIRAFQKFGEPRGAAWFFRERREDAEDLDAQIGGLESLEETISHASDLLTMSAGWREAWRNEQGPVQEDLASFERLCLAIRQTRGDMDVEQERTWRVHCSGRAPCPPRRRSTSSMPSPEPCACAPMPWRAGRWKPTGPPTATVVSVAMSPRRAVGVGARATATWGGGWTMVASSPTTRPRPFASPPPPRAPAPAGRSGPAPGCSCSSRRRSPASSPGTVRR